LRGLQGGRCRGRSIDRTSFGVVVGLFVWLRIGGLDTTDNSNGCREFTVPGHCLPWIFEYRVTTRKILRIVDNGETADTVLPQGMLRSLHCLHSSTNSLIDTR